MRTVVQKKFMAIEETDMNAKRGYRLVCIAVYFSRVIV